MFQIRQGDVLLTRVRKPRNARMIREPNGRPLASLRIEGRSGHAHVLPASVYEVGNRRLVFLDRPAALEHQEHRHVPIPAGWWEVSLQREYVRNEGSFRLDD